MAPIAAARGSARSEKGERDVCTILGNYFYVCEGVCRRGADLHNCTDHH